MSEKKWTEAQRAAISARGENLLVSAAAGSGKTAVMVERVVSLIREGVSIDEMLIVTFTRAAASDMRRKFHEKIAAEAGTDRRMREQLSLLETAEICTLHSFCAALLRDHFEKTDVAPDFRVVDGKELKAMDDEALDEILEEEFRSGDPAVASLNFGRGPDEIRENVLKLADFLAERAEPEAWLKNVLESDISDEYRKVILNEANRKRLEALAYFRAAYDLCTAEGGPYFNAEIVLNDMEMAKDEITSFDGFHPVFMRAGRAKKTDEIDPDLLARMKDLRDSGKKCMNKIQELLSVDPELMKSDAEASKSDIRVLGRMALRLLEERTRRKADRHVLTYGDLETQALKCLADDDICALVQNKYRCVFVDEYQDTSDIQNAILNRVAAPGTLFMVGDVKQSIYRFRSAEPRLFLEKYENFMRHDGGRMIALSTNFRSRPAILDFSNKVFEKVMVGGESEIVYDDRARLNPGRTFEGADPKVCVRAIVKDGELPLPEPEENGDGESEDEGETAEDLTKIAYEGALVAEEIRRLMARDPEIRYRDIAVLSRKSKNVLGEIYASLQTAGIPAYIDTEGGYYDSYEVALIMALLKIIVNPNNDPEWIMAMRSVLGGFSMRELAEIRIACREGSFYTAILHMTEEKTELGEKMADFVRKIDDFAALAPALSVSGLIDRILTETGLMVYFANLPGCATRKKNLTMLMEKADRFESTYMDGLSGFILQAQRERSDNDTGSAHELGEADDVVRLMTVHKSKGLEFKAVFGVNLGADFTKKRSPAMPLTDMKYGIGMPYIDRELGVKRKTMAQIVMEKSAQTMDTAEELRILYVLLTRPMEYLYLIGTVGDLNKAENRWEMIRNGAPVYKSYLDIVMGTVTEEDAEIAYVPEGAIPYLRAEEGNGKDDTLRVLTEALRDPLHTGELYDRVYSPYPHEDAALLPTKLTASGLERLLQGPKAPAVIGEEPRFLSGKKPGGAARGTAYHHAFYAMPLESLRGLCGRELERTVVREIEAMVKDRKLRADEAALLIPGYLTGLYESELGRRMLAAETVKREWKFNVMMPANRALESDEYPNDVDIVVQGSIDLAFYENGGWVLVDYKTDREPDTDEILARHRQQLRLYAEAIERITGQKVTERILWLVSRKQALAERE